MTIPSPQRENYVVSNQEQYRPSHSVAVEIHDRDGVLNAEDQRRLLNNTDNVEVAQVVKQVHYIVFRTNDENVNDTVENYLRDQRPDLIGKEYFTDGVLIIGVGLDPRQAFIFAGNDVADAFDLRKSAHLEQSLDAIKPGVKDGNIPAGLSNGLRTAVDVHAIEEQQYCRRCADGGAGRRWSWGCQRRIWYRGHCGYYAPAKVADCGAGS